MAQTLCVCDEITRELLAAVMECKIVQVDNKTRRSQFDKSVRELGLAIAGIEAKLEQPQVGGGALGKSAAGHHPFQKFQLQEFDGDRNNFPQFKKKWQKSMAAGTLIAGSLSFTLVVVPIGISTDIPSS